MSWRQKLGAHGDVHAAGSAEDPGKKADLSTRLPGLRQHRPGQSADAPDGEGPQLGGGDVHQGLRDDHGLPRRIPAVYVQVRVRFGHTGSLGVHEGLVHRRPLHEAVQDVIAGGAEGSLDSLDPGLRQPGFRVIQEGGSHDDGAVALPGDAGRLREGLDLGILEGNGRPVGGGDRLASPQGCLDMGETGLEFHGLQVSRGAFREDVVVAFAHHVHCRDAFPGSRERDRVHPAGLLFGLEEFPHGNPPVRPEGSPPARRDPDKDDFPSLFVDPAPLFQEPAEIAPDVAETRKENSNRHGRILRFP